MPTHFCTQAYDDLCARLAGAFGTPAWDRCVEGLNAVAYRYRAASEAADRFESEFSFAGDHYTQEEALFAFFFSATSAIECLLFAVYSFGAIFKPQLFAVGTDAALQAIVPDQVRKHFTRAFSGDPLAKAVEQLVNDPTRAQILEFRNFMAHRGAVPREHVLKPKDPTHVRIPEDTEAVYIRARPKSAVDSKARLKLDAQLAVRLRVWLSAHVERVVQTALDYCRAHPLPATSGIAGT
jgi:hypothetical protein